MISNNEIDIELLFKELVILPTDIKINKTDEILENAKDKDATIVKEEIAAYEEVADTNEIKTKTFALFTTPAIKLSILDASSNFQKIIKSQKIENTINYIETEFKITGVLKNIMCIWTIGLSPSQEQQLLHLNHPNILLSPNVETLKTKEEKLAMFEPFMQFINSNKELISQI